MTILRLDGFGDTGAHGVFARHREFASVRVRTIRLHEREFPSVIEVLNFIGPVSLRQVRANRRLNNICQFFYDRQRCGTLAHYQLHTEVGLVCERAILL